MFLLISLSVCDVSDRMVDEDFRIAHESFRKMFTARAQAVKTWLVGEPIPHAEIRTKKMTEAA
jgi:hypothetical protein